MLEVLTARPGVPSISLKWTSTLAPAGMIVFKARSPEAESDSGEMEWQSG